MNAKACSQCKCETKLVAINGHCRDTFSIVDANYPRKYGVLFDPYDELTKEELLSIQRSNTSIVEDTVGEFNGYVPEGLGVGDGDDLFMILCLNCGQVQNWKHVPQEKLDDVFAMDNPNNYNYMLTEYRKRKKNRG